MRCHRQGFSSQTSYLIGYLLQVRKFSAGNGNIRAGSGKPESRGLADATTAAGYQGYLAIQREIWLCHSLTSLEYLILFRLYTVIEKRMADATWRLYQDVVIQAIA
jgi:hypothetical protein